MSNVTEHAERYGADYYKSLPGAREDLPVNIVLPSPEIVTHMPAIRDAASNATAILELGPFLGTGSTMAIRQGVEDSSICDVWVTVDVVDHIHPWLKPHYPWWHLVIGDSSAETTVQDAEEHCTAFDLIFIDTMHTYAHLKRELEIWSRLAYESATWLFHDTWMLGQYNPMTDAIKEFAKENTGWEYANISKECNGLGALLPV